MEKKDSRLDFFFFYRIVSLRSLQYKYPREFIFETYLANTYRREKKIQFVLLTSLQRSRKIKIFRANDRLNIIYTARKKKTLSVVYWSYTKNVVHTK